MKKAPMEIKDISNYILLYKNKLAMAVVVVIFFFGIRRVYSHYSLQLLNLDQEAKIVKERKERIEKWKEVESEYKKVTSRFFDSVLQFRRFLEEKAEEYGISIGYLRPFQEEKELILEARVHFSFTSSYKNFIKFLQSLEARSIKVESLKIEKTSSPFREISLELIAFVLKEEK